MTLGIPAVNNPKVKTQESRFLPIPPAFNAPIRGFSQNIAMTYFGMKKMVWLSNVEKNF